MLFNLNRKSFYKILQQWLILFYKVKKLLRIWNKDLRINGSIQTDQMKIQRTNKDYKKLTRRVLNNLLLMSLTFLGMMIKMINQLLKRWMKLNLKSILTKSLRNHLKTLKLMILKCHNRKRIICLLKKKRKSHQKWHQAFNL